MHKNNALILLSGGLDSACLLAYYLERDFNVSCLWIDYNQLGKEYEKKAVDYFCRKYGIDLIKQEIVRDIVVRNKENMEYFGRNLLLISFALSMFPYKHGLICTGIRYTPNYFDCGEQFILEISRLIEDISGGLVLLDTPFFSCFKKNMLSFALKHDIDISRTYSCINGHPNGCRTCVSCMEREKALEDLRINGND